jgi:hypothetical protein
MRRQAHVHDRDRHRQREVDHVERRLDARVVGPYAEMGQEVAAKIPNSSTVAMPVPT